MISAERLRELLTECRKAAKGLQRAGDEAAAAGKFIVRENNWARASKFKDAASALAELQQLRAQGLSQEDREALERDAARYRWLRMGGYPMCTVDDEAIDAAIRRLGGQTT